MKRPVSPLYLLCILGWHNHNSTSTSGIRIPSILSNKVLWNDWRVVSVMIGNPSGKFNVDFFLPALIAAFDRRQSVRYPYLVSIRYLCGVVRVLVPGTMVPGTVPGIK